MIPGDCRGGEPDHEQGKKGPEVQRGKRSKLPWEYSTASRRREGAPSNKRKRRR